jgi:hypothetical protein
MPGVIEVLARAAIGEVVEDLVLVVQCSEPEDLRDGVCTYRFGKVARRPDGRLSASASSCTSTSTTSPDAPPASRDPVRTPALPSMSS